MRGYRTLGTAKVLIDKHGNTVIDKRSLRPEARFSGDATGDDDFGDDETGDDETGDDDLGARRRPRRKGRKARRSTKKKGTNMKNWGRTILSGSVTLGAAGTSVISIRPQHPFKARTIKAAGLASSLITSVRFGDKLIWDNPSGLDIAFLGAAATELGTLDNQTIPGGLDIQIGVSLPAAGTVSVMISGFKPKSAC